MVLWLVTGNSNYCAPFSYAYFFYGHFFHSLVYNVFDLILHTVKLQFQKIPEGGALSHHKPDLRSQSNTTSDRDQISHGGNWVH